MEDIDGSGERIARLSTNHLDAQVSDRHYGPTFISRSVEQVRALPDSGEDPASVIPAVFPGDVLQRESAHLHGFDGNTPHILTLPISTSLYQSIPSLSPPSTMPNFYPGRCFRAADHPLSSVQGVHDFGGAMNFPSLLGHGSTMSAKSAVPSHSTDNVTTGNHGRILLRPFLASCDQSPTFQSDHESGRRDRPLPPGQVFVGPEASSSLVGERLVRIIADSDSGHRQVGTLAGTLAAAARRGPGAPRYFCDFVGCNSEGFTSKQNHEYHVLAHKDERPFICSRCEHAFRSRNDLRRHIQKRKKPCKCPDQKTSC
ncbi:hypothetical protein PM082_017649 [Marasmius tenuissimus]|nr:hypothetical protein PM082_017649 [Marasmius tenuissimus]